MGWGTEGSGQELGFYGRIETVTEVDSPKGKRIEVEHTDAVILLRGESDNEIVERPLSNGKRLVFLTGFESSNNARDAYYKLMGVPKGTEPDLASFAGTTFEYKTIARRGGDFKDYLPVKIREVAAEGPKAEPLSFKKVAALLNGKTPKESMALREVEGIKGTTLASFVGIKSKVLDPSGPFAGLVEYDEATGTYKAV